MKLPVTKKNINCKTTLVGELENINQNFNILDKVTFLQNICISHLITKYFFNANAMQSNR